ncbi:MAG TPA: L,D-transpeptidase family protein [Usitatibacter sp.]|nr:L,D-transpeptidase family protein [Usitatibacter sp.]
MESIHRGLRLAQRLAIVGFATAASALADGSPVGSFSFGGAPAFANEIEGALVRAIVDLRQSGLQKALGEIDKALERSPNFRLGYMIKGDLLMARAGKPAAFGAKAVVANADVAPLQDEARVRVQRYVAAPPVEFLPTPLMLLAPGQAHVLLVDTSRSRLFVYANDHGRPRYVTDFYISIGKNGVEKQREADQKTPIGVYTVVAEREKLPDFYGPRAFPISYPNDWDRMNGRGGHGIWLHGTPSDTYSRAPWATDGCVVLTNDDLAKLSKYVDVSRTPVVIGQGVEWRDPLTWETQRDAFMKAFNAWKADWESLDNERYFSHYAAAFTPEAGDAASWKARKLKVNAGKTWVKVGIGELSAFAYPGVKDMVMVSFEQDYRSSNASNRTLKRQYWIREGGSWRILHEIVVS